MRSLVIAVALTATVLGVVSCGGNGTSSPSAPTDSPAQPAGTIVIDIVGINGARSFSPNPATVPAGQMVVWHNVDTVTHHVMLDDDAVDTGDIRPGAFSRVTTLGASHPYHCSIHPSMVGGIVRGQ